MKENKVLAKSITGRITGSPLGKVFAMLCLAVVMTGVASAQGTGTEALWTMADTEVSAASTAIVGVITALAVIPAAFFVYGLFKRALGRG